MEVSFADIENVQNSTVGLTFPVQTFPRKK